jgi:phospholipid/cholesterol/gamma-HCH transport system substrate-binding protein
MKKEIKIGILVLLTLVTLIWGLNFLKGKNFFSNTKTYYVIYDDVSGLLESNGVFIKGYKVGHVSDINFSDRTKKKLRVVLAIESDIKVPKGSIARIYSLDLIGNKAVELIFSNSTEYIGEKGALIGQVEFSVAKQLEPYKIQAYNLLNSMDSLSNSFLAVVNPATIKNLRGIIKNLNLTTQTIVESSEDIKSSFNNIQILTQNLKENNKRISEMLKNLDAFSDSLVHLRLQTSVEKLNRTLDETQQIVSEIKSGKGTIGKLLMTDSLYDNLNKTTLDLDSLIKNINSNPKHYINFSVFGSKKN